MPGFSKKVRKHIQCQLLLATSEITIVEDMESKEVAAADRFAFRRTGRTSPDVAIVVAMLVCRGVALLGFSYYNRL
ncbi:hypothetical protein [Gracilibacillus alcaliphilus]|uniref:hypothetical protein n=1 Tax=Gracilibacillus alcaliphilus TaxID=1401441 RepID=UPI0019596C2D|nr:hypothetical protein [Gracilibacillus alcaliphilus]MBM7675439.1 hypothetical protein [Gracilibacillus alcaliphilus]